MKKRIMLVGFLGVAMFAVGFAGIGFANAQTTATVQQNAAQVVGTRNSQMLRQGLSTLGGTLDTLGARLNAGNRPSNTPAIQNSLSAIRNSLISINGTVASLMSRSNNVAINGSGSPGLPNTGGGGARFIK